MMWRLFKDKYGTFIDPRDGNVCRTVKIGKQVWMAENLKATKYRNNDVIPRVSNGREWENLPTGAYCACNALNAEDYGYLYNWYAVNDSRGLAPEGWHIPSDEEWQILIDYLGGDKVAGGKMKSLNHWISPNKGATNKSGFSALPGGFCSSYGNFDDWHYYAYFWSSTSFTLETGGSYAWQRKLYTNLAEVTRDYLTKEWGLSVRCVKD